MTVEYTAPGEDDDDMAPAPVITKRGQGKVTERVAPARRNLDGSDGPIRPQDLDWYYVKNTHPDLHKRIKYRSVSEKRARAWLIAHYPRGSEAYLELPDGTTEHYEHERSGDYGMDIEQWVPFDPDSWIPPDTQAPPGESAWSDKEG